MIFLFQFIKIELIVSNIEMIQAKYNSSLKITN